MARRGAASSRLAILAVLVAMSAAASTATTRRALGGGGAALVVGGPRAASAAAVVDPRSSVKVLGRDGKLSVALPRVGFGLYKTKKEETFEAVTLALGAGARLFDSAASYGNEAELGAAVRASGVPRADIFVSTKATPQELQTAGGGVKAVEAALTRLGLDSVDCFSLHSPLCPRAERLEAYAGLLAARDAGLTRTVGVANFGARHLDELPEPPALLSLELSPYNQRPLEVAWARRRGTRVTCGAYSKLSGAYNWGSDAMYRALMAVCKNHRATRAQVLVRWSVQRGFVPLPRSGTSDKDQRLAIAQNSAAGVSDGATWANGPLTPAEMAKLDGLEDHLRSGRLGRADGWAPEDVAGPDWDPTTYVA